MTINAQQYSNAVIVKYSKKVSCYVGWIMKHKFELSSVFPLSLYWISFAKVYQTVERFCALCIGGVPCAMPITKSILSVQTHTDPQVRVCSVDPQVGFCPVLNGPEISSFLFPPILVLILWTSVKQVRLLAERSWQLRTRSLYFTSLWISHMIISNISCLL